METQGDLAELRAEREDQDLEERARPFRALYEHWERNQWSPLEIDYSTDAASFAALDEEARQGFVWIFAHRFHAEFKVATVLAPFLLRATDHQLQAALATQIADEFRHLTSVLRVYEDVFGISDIAAVKAIADANTDANADTVTNTFTVARHVEREHHVSRWRVAVRQRLEYKHKSVGFRFRSVDCSGGLLPW
jgi:ribonucleotide reductase beta subunit family protein with ferritin-like domain